MEGSVEIFRAHVLGSVSGLLAPPRRKAGCPAPQKAGLASPRPVKMTKPVGRSGSKLIADSIDPPFHYAHKLCLRGRKSWKIFSFDFVYRLFTENLLK